MPYLYAEKEKVGGIMVEAFRIKGKASLNGEVKISGAKNAALPILIATLIEKGTYILRNVPNLMDIRTLMNLLRELGLEIEKIDEDSYRIENTGIKSTEAPYELVKKMRASFLVMGPMLAHEKKARVSLPGGCAIGARPVDYHLKGFEALGAKIDISHGYVEAEVAELVGANIIFDFPSVGATENVVMAAVKAKGRTVIENAASEPEVEDLCNFLNAMGAKIKGIGTSRLDIEGVDKLFPCEYSIIPDRIEAGTFLIASIMTEGEIKIKGIDFCHLESFIMKLQEMGVKIKQDGDFIWTESKTGDLKSIKVQTMPHPGFPTDLQAQMMSLMSAVPGTGEVKETVFENRFMHIPELNRMGANIHVDGNVAVINGGQEYSGAEVMASDLRAGASLVLAALVAEGETVVNRIYHIDRGYENLEGKLSKLGAKIERIKVEV